MAIFGLGFIAFGGMIPLVFASGPIIMIMGLIMMVIAGYIMSKTWSRRELIRVDSQGRKY